MSDHPAESRSTSALEFLAADEATQAAAAAANEWMEIYYNRARREGADHPHLHVVLRKALAAVARLLDADAVSLLLANENGTELVARAAFGLPREIELPLSIPSGAGVAGPILATGVPRRIADLTQENIIGEVLRASRHRSFVGVPLTSGGRIFGVLHATRRDVREFDQNDVDLLTRFAQPIAASIERVRLFEAEQAARLQAELATERVRALQRVTAAFISATTVNEICQIIIEAATDPISGGERAIWMLQDSRLVLVAGNARSREYPEIPLTPSLPAAENLREGTPLFIETREELTRRWPILADGETSAFAGLPLIVDEQRLGLMAVGFHHDHRFSSDEREFLTALAEHAAAALARALSRAELQEARNIADARREQLDFLAVASERLSGSLDLDVTLITIASMAIPRLTDRCIVFLLDDGTITKQVIGPDLNVDESELFESLNPTLSAERGAGMVIRTGRTVYMREVDDSVLVGTATSEDHLALLRRVGFGGVLMLPLRARGRVFGVLALVNQHGRPLEETERALAEELGARAAVAIDNALLYRTESHVARRLSESLLPARTPSVRGLDIAVHYRPGSAGLDVGGDFYDVFETSAGRSIVVIGDVQGKGVEAAAVTGLARHTIRAAAQFESSPAALLRHLNTAIVRNIIENARNVERPWDSARLCTAAIVCLAHGDAGWTATSSCAGHPLPLVRRVDGTIESLSEPAMLLGVREHAHYQDSAVALRPGEIVVLYTDGVSDRLSDDETFGTEGISEVLRRIDGAAELAIRAVVDKALTYRSPHNDDLALVAVRVEH